MPRKKPSDWTLFLRHAKREGAVCYGRAPTPRDVSARLEWAGRPGRVRHLVSVSSGGFRYYAFKDREQLEAFIAAVPLSLEIDIAST